MYKIFFGVKIFYNLKKLHFCFISTITKLFILLDEDKQVCLGNTFI